VPLNGCESVAWDGRGIEAKYGTTDPEGRMQVEFNEIAFGNWLGAGASFETRDLPRIPHRVLTPLAASKALAGDVARFE